MGSGFKPDPITADEPDPILNITQNKTPRRINKDILLINPKTIFFILLGFYFALRSKNAGKGFVAIRRYEAVSESITAK